MDEAWLETVRLARDCGDISSLFPRGITRLVDLPWTLHQAIRMALYYLSFEELPKKERPPKDIWEDTDALTAWFKQVEADREAELNPNGTNFSSVREMPQNDLIKEMFPGLKV